MTLQEWLKRGHGSYREIFGEKDFFAEMKGEERMVCHFFRDNWPCKVSACASYLCTVRWLAYPSTASVPRVPRA